MVLFRNGKSAGGRASLAGWCTDWEVGTLSFPAACIGKAGSLVLHSCLSSFLLSHCAVVVVVVSGAFSSSLDIRLHDTNRNSIVALIQPL